MGEQRKGKVRIVADTTSVIPEEFVSAHALEVAPQVIIFGEESYLEGVELPTEEFIRRMKESPQPPKTAAPPPGEFVKAFERQLAEAETIIAILPSAEVSGTVRSAQTAKESFPDADIRIIDTNAIAGCVGSLVQAAVLWAEEGMSADEIVARVEAMAPRAHTYFLIRTLEYLQRGGRIGGASALLGSVLQIKPILEIRDGHVEVLERVRVHSRARERMLDLVLARCPRSPEAHLCVMHTDCFDDAQAFAAQLQEIMQVGEIPIYECGAAITTHGGPGILGVGFFV